MYVHARAAYALQCQLAEAHARLPDTPPLLQIYLPIHTSFLCESYNAMRGPAVPCPVDVCALEHVLFCSVL